MRVIALANQKGGVAKTTSTLNIGAGLARSGKKVLLLDLDPQANLTEACGENPDTLELTTYDALIEGVSIKDVIVSVGESLDLAPASGELISAEVKLLELEDKNLLLRKALKKARDYDYVLIDCPPSLGQITVNALCAAKEVFVPMQTEFFALRGLQKLLGTIQGVRDHSNKSLRFSGVFGTKYDSRKNLHRQVVAEIRKHFESETFNTLIRDNVALAEASAAGMNIFDYRNSSNGAIDYKALCEEIVAMEAN